MDMQATLIKGNSQLLKQNCKQLSQDFSVLYVLSCAITHVQTGLQNAWFMIRFAKPAKIYTFKKVLCVLTTPARPTSVPKVK